MTRWLRVLRTMSIAFVALLGLGVAIIYAAFPRQRPASEFPFGRAPGDAERGRYLVEHVANCLDCHSDRDWTYYGGPVVAGTEGRGAPLRVLRPQTSSANITPAALGEWTDGEIARAITAGVGRDGRPLHPFMPYDSYACMSPEDVAAVVAYLRRLPPIEHSPPPPEEPLPIRLIARLLPRPYVPPEPIAREDTVARGRYLAGMAECSFCHGGDFAGGRSFRVPDSEMDVASENITPHPSNRIGAWSRENFVNVFKSFEPPEGRGIPGDDVNTVMPWSRYAGMSEEDLGAIYDFLRTLEPIAQEPSRPVDPAAPAAGRAGGE